MVRIDRWSLDRYEKKSPRTGEISDLGPEDCI